MTEMYVIQIQPGDARERPTNIDNGKPPIDWKPLGPWRNWFEGPFADAETALRWLAGVPWRIRETRPYPLSCCIFRLTAPDGNELPLNVYILDSGRAAKAAFAAHWRQLQEKKMEAALNALGRLHCYGQVDAVIQALRAGGLHDPKGRQVVKAWCDQYEGKMASVSKLTKKN